MALTDRLLRRIAAAAIAALLAGCGGVMVATDPAPVAASSTEPVLKAVAMDRALEDRILALDPDRVTPTDVRDTLAKAPAPRIILLHGGVYPVHLAMTSFAHFLIGMGYPEERIKHPGDDRWSHSPYEPSERVAGMVAWFYEREGVRPMLIGHSQGGMQAIKILHDLAGTFGASLPVWNPVSERPEARTAIVDPITGRDLPVVGNKVSYTSAVGAGGPSGVLPNQWAVITRIREIPDTTLQFDGFFIGIDWFAMTFTDTGVPRFTNASGNVVVRNVVLPAGYLHVTVPTTHHLPGNPQFRSFIENYRPTGERPDETTMPGSYSDNVLYAAENWYMIRRHWTLEAQRFVRARRALLAGG
jgi:pimeloyl-ACP methyl ester carboxylesterase